MSQLTEAQIQFLLEQNITSNLLFDGQGLSKTEYREKMKSQGKLFVFNITPCLKSGHTLRDRSGHCIQCDTANIGFTKRSAKAGFVYIAKTRTGGHIKIGFTENVKEREKSLNRTKYAEFDDWQILFNISCVNAGKLEIEVKKQLSKYASSKTYKHDGKKQISDELYCCEYSEAKDLLKKLAENSVYNSEIVFE